MRRAVGRVLSGGAPVRRGLETAVTVPVTRAFVGMGFMEGEDVGGEAGGSHGHPSRGGEEGSPPGGAARGGRGGGRRAAVGGRGGGEGRGGGRGVGGWGRVSTADGVAAQVEVGLPGGCGGGGCG